MQEYADGHTRSVLLRGGSNYRPSQSGWYLPETLRGTENTFWRRFMRSKRSFCQDRRGTNIGKSRRTACSAGDRSIAPTLNEHEKYFLFDDRYERAGTVGFRCAADPPAAELASAVVGTACKGGFDAPDAFTSLTTAGVKDWATYGLVARMASGSKELPANVTALAAGAAAAALTYCPQYSKSAALKTSGQTFNPPPVVSAGAVSFSWTDGDGGAAAAANNISTGLCSPSGLRFTLPAKAFQADIGGDGELAAASGRTLTIWAGVSAGTLQVNASLLGSSSLSPPFYKEELAAAPSDLKGNVLRSNKWVFNMPISTAAATDGYVDAAPDLVVDFVVKKPPTAAAREVGGAGLPFVILQAASLQ